MENFLLKKMTCAVERLCKCFGIRGNREGAGPAGSLWYRTQCQRTLFLPDHPLRQLTHWTWGSFLQDLGGDSPREHSGREPCMWHGLYGRAIPAEPEVVLAVQRAAGLRREGRWFGRGLLRIGVLPSLRQYLLAFRNKLSASGTCTALACSSYGC
jgi:hypothetical protein